jgi:hypothetical protein
MSVEACLAVAMAVAVPATMYRVAVIAVTATVPATLSVAKVMTVLAILAVRVKVMIVLTVAMTVIALREHVVIDYELFRVTKCMGALCVC